MNLISPSELTYITDALVAQKRTDGRPLLSFRELHLSTSVIPNSAGSARAACAGTDVLVGCRLESANVDDEEDQIQISLEVSQGALQSLPSDPSRSLGTLAACLTSPLLGHPQLSIISGRKHWQIHIHISLLASSGGANLHDVLAIALRSALWDLKIPRTREVAYVQAGRKAADHAGETSDAGIKALLKGKKASADVRTGAGGTGAADFELIDYEADAGAPLQGRDDLPVSLSLYLIPQSHQPFIDATLHESFASPTRLVCTFDGEGNIRGLQQEIPDGYMGSAPTEIPFKETETLLDISGNLSSKLLKSLNERLRDPQTSQGGVRLGAYP